MNLKQIMGHKHIFFDGAMGTIMQQRGVPTGYIPELCNIENPQLIIDIHKEYILAGCSIISANTFGANSFKMSHTGYSVSDIVSAAINCAKTAIREVGRTDVSIALDIGPLGQLLKPLGVLAFEDAYNSFKEIVLAGRDAGANFILIETMTDIYEAKAAVLAAKENCDLPIICTMTFDETGRTMTGSDIEVAVAVLEGLRVDALGINCSVGPDQMLETIERMARISSTPMIVQPNAGLPKIQDGMTVYDVTATQFAQHMKTIAKIGVNIFGGCCGTTPEYIKRTIESLDGVECVFPKKKHMSVISSYSQCVEIGKEPVVIGERINPTGKKRFKEALISNDISYIIVEAIMQRDCGAHVLDVNVGLPDIDEVKVMCAVVTELQSVLPLPLQIDSSSPQVLEAALRIYNGKAIVNSVNGKQSVMDAVFPLVQKYGGMVVGLTLDESGIPLSAVGRFAVAKKIVDEAKKYGINENDIIIDTLTLTASAQQAEVVETLKALKMVKDKLGVKTCLGVSNVSFGLPNRDSLNSAFLAMALYEGLDACIINPASTMMMDAIFASSSLLCKDVDSQKYIAKFSKPKDIQSVSAVVGQPAKSQEPHTGVENDGERLKLMIVNGQKDKSAQITKKLLLSEPPLDIVQKYLIAALNEVGEKFNNKEFFLPQLIQSAETVNRSFEVIKQHYLDIGEKQRSKGSIVLATVEGDVHDIGKNIVKVLLENYGFNIIDLGKNVIADDVVNAVLENDIELVGLSALMTTTVENMKKTIELLSKSCPKCKVMVGGAVLTQKYADMIGADYYAKDAMGAVLIANKTFA